MKIKISDDNIRKKFFYLVKNRSKKSWNEIGEELRLPQYTFQRYRSGVSLIPENLFLYFLNELSDSDKRELLNFVEEFPDNFGQIKGGKKAYSTNFEEFEKGRKKGAFCSKTKKRKKFTFYNELSEDICEFAGAFIGDGFFNCYNNKLYQVEFSGDSRFEMDYYNDKIIPIVKDIIQNIKPKIYKRKGNALRVVFYSKELYCFLRDFLGFIPGKKTYTVKIPKKILVRRAFIYSTIRGIFDTDGGFFLDRRKSYKRPYPRIIFQTVSHELYEQLIEYLSKDFKVYSFFNKKRKIYGIEIYGYNQLKKWVALIGFSNPKHLKKIASIA